MGLFGVSLRTLGMAPGCHGAVPLQQPTLNLISYCTGCPPQITLHTATTASLQPGRSHTPRQLLGLLCSGSCCDPRTRVHAHGMIRPKTLCLAAYLCLDRRG